MGSKCDVSECKNSSKYSQGLCSSHYMRKWRYGNVDGGTNGVTHGMTNTSEYRIWAQMKSRCLNLKDKSYSNYGGRGIKVCDRWLTFEGFIADMGIRPSTKHSIDRKDNNGNYEPTNCRWALPGIQVHNRRAYNKLGIKGVFTTPYNTFKVVVTKDGRTLQKNYKTLAEAINGYATLERSLYV